MHSQHCSQEAALCNLAQLTTGRLAVRMLTAVEVMRTARTTVEGASEARRAEIYQVLDTLQGNACQGDYLVPGFTLRGRLQEATCSDGRSRTSSLCMKRSMPEVALT